MTSSLERTGIVPGLFSLTYVQKPLSHVQNPLAHVQKPLKAQLRLIYVQLRLIFDLIIARFGYTNHIGSYTFKYDFHPPPPPNCAWHWLVALWYLQHLADSKATWLSVSCFLALFLCCILYCRLKIDDRHVVLLLSSSYQLIN